MLGVAVRDAAWVYRHLYNPRIYFTDSNCPPQTGMFIRHEIGEKPSPNAARVEGRYEWIPNDAAKNLSKGLDGHYYLVPIYNYPWVVFYNKSTFRQKGYNIPKTWDALNAAQ